MPSPLFILTCMRSYSSLVCGMLGQHPDLYGLPEVNLFATDTLRELVTLFRRVRPRSLNGLLRTIAQLEHGEQTEKSIDAAWEWLNRRLEWSTQEMFYHIVQRVPHQRCIDKSPMTVLRPKFLQRMQRYFPRAQYIHLTRHPRPTCLSIHRLLTENDTKTGSHKAEETDPEQLWLQGHQNILSFERQIAPGQMIRIQGEVLLAEPERYLPQIERWLGITSSIGTLEEMKHPENSPYACIGPSNAPFGNDPNFLKKPFYVKQPIPKSQLAGTLDYLAPHEPERGFTLEAIALAKQLGYS